MYLLLEIVLSESRIGQGASNAVFTESTWMDVHAEQEIIHRRIGRTVTLEFDDNQMADVCIASGFVIVEMHTQIDGQSFRESFVYEGNSFEPILDMLAELVHLEPGLFGHKINAIRERHAIHLGNLDAFLLGASVVVFVLDFEEGVLGVQILSDSYLLTDFSTRLM